MGCDNNMYIHQFLNLNFNSLTRSSLWRQNLRAVVVLAVLVTWITIIVLLPSRKPNKRALVVEGKKITKVIARFVVKILLKEGNVVEVVCAILGYFAPVGKTVRVIDSWIFPFWCLIELG